MSKFKVLVRGRNFRFAYVEAGDETVKLTGFYVWRAVEAVDPIAVESKVMELLRSSPTLRARRNKPDDPPVMFVDDMQVLLDDADLDEINRTGLIFFQGRGAGRPRRLRLAAGHSLPRAVRRVVARIWPGSRPVSPKPE